MAKEVRFDYEHQAWMERGTDGAYHYVRCGHQSIEGSERRCFCYGTKYEGLTFEQARKAEEQRFGGGDCIAS